MTLVEKISRAIERYRLIYGRTYGYGYSIKEIKDNYKEYYKILDLLSSFKYTNYTYREYLNIQDSLRINNHYIKNSIFICYSTQDIVDIYISLGISCDRCGLKTDDFYFVSNINCEEYLMGEVLG